MADNFAITTGVGLTIGADDISSVYYQRIKLIHGADGVNAGDVSTSNGLPIQDTAAIADNGAFTDGTSKVSMAGYIYDEVAGTALTENDAAAARINVNRAQIAILEDSTTRGRYATITASNALKVDGSAVTQPVSIAGTVTIASPAVTNAGTFAVQDSQVIADNGAFTDGTSKVFMAGYIYDEVAGTGLTENDAAAGRINVNRAVVGAIEDGVTRGRYATVTASNAVKVDASATTQPVSNAGTFVVQDSQVIADNGAFTDGTSKLFMTGYIYDDVAGTALTENDAAAPRVSVNRATVCAIEDGSTRARYATVTASNALKTDGSATTQPVSGTITASNTAGDVAHDGVDSGNPVKMGGQARTTNPTAVADADRTNAIFDKLGKQICVGAIRELKGVQQTNINASTTETTIVTAVASTFLDLYGLIITNNSATTTKVTIKDATAGTTRAVFEVAGTLTVGFTLPVDSAIPQAAVNSNWTATCGTSVNSVDITAMYVKNL